MRLIKLTSIEKRDVAIVVNEIVSIERGDYIDWELEKSTALQVDQQEL